MPVHPNAAEPSASSPVGDVIAAYKLSDDCLLLLGWLDGRVPAEGTAALKDKPGERGRFRTIAWPQPAEGRPSTALGFLAAVRVPGIAAVAAPGDLLGLQEAQSRRQTIARLPAPVPEADRFVAMIGPEIRDIAAAAAIAFARALAADKALRGSPAASTLLAAILRAAAPHDGFIEIIGGLPRLGAMVQGWCNAAPGDTPEILIEAGGLVQERAAAAAIGRFARDDIAAPACGIVGLVGGGDIDPSAVQNIYVLTRVGGEYRRLEVVPNRPLLAPAETPFHLRDMLPKLQASPEVMRTLRRATRPRYAGHDTLTESERPIRVAVDVAVRIDGTGFYLTGWMLDPRRLVSAVLLRSVGGLSVRLDETWTRVPRADVTAGFRQDPVFAASLSESADGVADMHGFTVFAPVPEKVNGGIEHFYLELEIGADDCAFVPVAVAAGDTQANRRKILTSFDIHKPTAYTTVERHIGPMFHALRHAAQPPIGFRERTVAASAAAAAPARRRVDTSIIVPMVEDGRAAKPVLAQFGIDALAPDEELVLVCSATVPDRTLRMIAGHLGFYGIAGRVIVAEEAVDFCTAYDIGVRATVSDNLLFLSPAVFGREFGWIGRLRAEMARLPQPAPLSPTLLFEDFSVKFAGIEGIEEMDGPPYVAPAIRYAGYPISWLERERTEAAPALAGTLECCLMPRALYETVGGFSSGYALGTLKDLDFFLRLRARGVQAVWTPSVVAYALDEGSTGDPDYWVQTGQLVDGWSFRESWRTAFTEAGRAAAPAAALAAE
jgi:hypothetical protein